MTREQAEALMKTLLALDGPIGAVDLEIAKLEDAEEQKAFRKPLGDLMGLIYTEMMVPIIRRFPELGEGVDR